MAEYAGEGRLTEPDPASPGADQLASRRSSSACSGSRCSSTRPAGASPRSRGALALTVFNLPLMARLAEQAIRAVPRRRARAPASRSGRTKWQTIRHVVLPLAIPGIVTGHHPHRRPDLRRGGGPALHGRPVDADQLRLRELQPDRPALAVEPVPPGDDAVGLHLEAQLRGPRRLRPPDRGRRRRGPGHRCPGLQPRRPRPRPGCSSAGITGA